MTRLADIVKKARPLFTLSLEMTRLVNETRLLLVPGVNSDIYGVIILTKIQYSVINVKYQTVRSILTLFYSW